MKFTTIVSGSSGNCVYVEGGRTGLLIDAGCSIRALRAALADLHIEESHIAGILITHEHSDHISGAARISRRLSLPLYASELTWENLPFREDFFAWERHIFDYGMEIGDIGLDFFRLSHDAAQPVGFVFEQGGRRVGLATDTGVITPSMRRLLKDVDALIFEANHDRPMLMNGPYPRYLKQRVASERGHLSNEQDGASPGRAGRSPGPGAVLLAHLSATNNTPELAREAVAAALASQLDGNGLTLSVAPRFTPPCHDRLGSIVTRTGPGVRSGGCRRHQRKEHPRDRQEFAQPASAFPPLAAAAAGGSRDPHDTDMASRRGPGRLVAGPGAGMRPVVRIFPLSAVCFRDVSPAVVYISSATQVDGDNGDKELKVGSGSGVICSEDGYIITNYHVINGRAGDRSGPGRRTFH